MNYNKFISLLNTSSLYFRRVDKYPRLDTYEAHLSIPDKEHILKNLCNNNQEYADRFTENFLSLKSKTFLNCWSKEHPNYRYLWELFKCQNDGIAISTIVNKLKDSYTSITEYNFFIADIEYIDPISDPLGRFNGNRLFCRKPNSFKNEKEVRSVICLNENTDKDHINIKVNLNDLISEIYITPNADASLIQKTQALINFHGINKRIQTPSFRF